MMGKQRNTDIQEAWARVLEADNREQKARDALTEAEEASEEAWAKYAAAKMEASA